MCAVSCLCGLAHCGGGIICGDIIITLVTTIIIVRFDTFIFIFIHCGEGIVCVCPSNALARQMDGVWVTTTLNNPLTFA